MKLNKKGITSVELLVSFIIVSVIVISMYNFIMNYQNKAQIQNINSEVITYSNNIQKIIQDDLIKRHLINVEVKTQNEATFTFDNNYQTTLIIDSNMGSIKYGKKDSKLVNYKIPKIDDLKLSANSSITYDETTNYLIIKIIFTHPNFEDGTYYFTITCPVNFKY